MKKALIGVGACLALLSCSSDSVDAKLGKKTLKYQETLALTGGSLTFAEVQDSRCPEGVQCVRAGEVVVTLQARSGAATNESQNVRMCLGDCEVLFPEKGFREKDTANVSLNGANYRLILTEVNPYPNATKSVPKKDYSLTLEVE